MKNLIISNKLECGCKYVHRKRNSQDKFWIFCDEAKRLWSEYKTDIENIKKRNQYHQHFKQYQIKST